MKKHCLTILALLLALCCLGALAEDADADIVRALDAAGLAQPVQIERWGDTAAVLAHQGEAKALVLLQRREGRWAVSLCNPNALIQDADWPSLLLDSDQALFWTYVYTDKQQLTFHCEQDAAGRWGPVDQCYMESGFGTDTHAWALSWDAAHGGEITRRFTVSDENDNLKPGEIVQYIPASWLADAVALCDFDVARFPMLLDTSYQAEFAADRFFQEAAAALLPEMDYLKGVLMDGVLHFLVRRPDGQKVYVVCEYESGRKVRRIESTPLPQDAVLGYENFTDCLAIGGRCMSIRLLSPERAGLSFLYDRHAEGCLCFGDRTVWSADDAWASTILCGEHPWDDLTQIDWNALPESLSEAALRMDARGMAVVANPNPSDRLHLRQNPDRASASLGKYYNGTMVTILRLSGDWAEVRVGSRRGWMMTAYLDFAPAQGGALRLDTRAMPQLFPIGEALRVFERPEAGDGALQRDSLFKVIGILGEEWYHVYFPWTGMDGFVLQQDLWPGNG